MTETEKKMLRVGLRARMETRERKTAARRAADPKHGGKPGQELESNFREVFKNGD